MCKSTDCTKFLFMRYRISFLSDTYACFELKKKNRATSYKLKHPPHTHKKKKIFFFTACFSFFSAHRWYSDIFNICWVWIIVSQNILMRNTKNLFNQRKRSDVRLKKICQLLLKRKKKVPVNNEKRALYSFFLFSGVYSFWKKKKKAIQQVKPLRYVRFYNGLFLFSPLWKLWVLFAANIFLFCRHFVSESILARWEQVRPLLYNTLFSLWLHQLQENLDF